MTTEKMIIDAYGHLLTHYPSYADMKPIFEKYALEELQQPPRQAKKYFRWAMVEDEKEINSPEFAHFYTWYYVNIMTAGIEWDTRLIVPDTSQFNNISVIPLEQVFRDGSVFYSQANPGEALLWTVLAKRPDGTTLALAQCASEAAAGRIYHLIVLLLTSTGR